MKIAIGRGLPLLGDGVTRVIECWARILGGAGHEVTVVSVDWPSAITLPPMPGVQSIVLPHGGDGKRPRPLPWSRDVASTIGRLADRPGSDLVISHDPLLATALRARAIAAPLVGTFHSPLVDENQLQNWTYAASRFRRLTYPVRRWVLRRKERRALAAVDIVHTLSRFTWSRLTHHYPHVTADGRWRRIPGSFDDRRFVPPADRAEVRRRLGLEADATLLVSVRRLVPRTGVDRIVTAARELHGRFPGARFLIGGTGEQEPSLRREIAAAGLESSVRMLGFIPEHELAAYYQAADVFLMPTRALECFGLPVIEAMGCGCPSLVTPGDGPEEVCADFPDWVARVNTDAAFTERVQRYLEGSVAVPDDLARRARARYSDEAIRPRILELVEELRG